MPHALKEAIVRLAYLAALGREPEDVPTLENWANAIADDGSNVDVIVTQIGDSPEAQDFRRRLHAAIG